MRLSWITALPALPLLASAGAAVANNRVEIDGGPVGGIVMVNAASGGQNQQANVGTAARGANAVSQIQLHQGLSQSGLSSPADTATIAASAFAGANGWIAVNGAAGNDNQLANVGAFTFAIESAGLSDIQLDQSSASTRPTSSPALPGAQSAERTAAIGDGAFRNASGLVQVNLIGGDRNASANSFAATVLGPAGN